MAEITYGISAKGAQTLIYNSHEYTFLRKTAAGIIHWRCRFHHSAKCKSLLHTLDDNIVKFPSEHTHDIRPFVPLARKAVGRTDHPDNREKKLEGAGKVCSHKTSALLIYS